MIATQSKAGFFRLGSFTFAVDQSYLRQVTKVSELAKVPRSYPSFLGLFAVRGSIIPLVDLTYLLGMSSPGRPLDLALVIEYQKESFAFSIDEMLGLFTYALPEIETPHSLQAFAKPLTDTYQSLLLDIPAVSTQLEHYLRVV
jgi:purine-binding chemotaxis protein CheW